jgi:hypothetical protein
MRVVLDCYYDDLEQRCLTEGCGFVVGPYDEQWHGGCPRCQGRLGFFRAFGAEAERSVEVRREQARISGAGY